MSSSKPHKELIRAKAFNKVWSKIINIKTKQNDWNKAPHAFLDEKEIEDVNVWFDKELEIYIYLMELIKKDTE